MINIAVFIIMLRQNLFVKYGNYILFLTLILTFNNNLNFKPEILWIGSSISIVTLLKRYRNEQGKKIYIYDRLVCAKIHKYRQMIMKKINWKKMYGI